MRVAREQGAGEQRAEEQAGEELLASVVIPHYNDKIRLQVCLASLETQSVPRHRYQIIVADNGTPGGVADVAARFPAVRFVEERRKGAAHARNAAVAVATGAALAFIDADCVAEPEWLEEGVRALEGADLAGGAIRLTAREEDAPTAVEVFEMMFGFRQQQYIEKQKFAVTANLFARRSVFAAVGGFRHGLAEDTDWCWRATAAGYTLRFAPKAKVSHPARHDWSELVAKWQRLVEEKYNGMRQQRGFAPRWLLLALLVAGSSVPHGLQVLLSRNAIVSRRRLATVAVLARIRLWRSRRMLALLAGAGRRPGAAAEGARGR